MTTETIAVSKNLLKEIESLNNTNLGKKLIGTDIEKEVALKALEKIKWNADVQAFFSRPVVVIAMGIALIFVSMMLIKTFDIFWITGFLTFSMLYTALIVSLFAGLRMISCGISDFIRGESPKLKYFKELSRETEKHIERVRESTNSKVEFIS
jgi:hypothetical protein